MPSITQRMLDVVANQQQYSSNQVSGMADVIAKLFGVQSASDMPPEWQGIIRQIAYAVSNNYGDQLGLLNQGNMFANIHQAILTQGGLESRDVGGSLLGVSYGSSVKSVQVADILTKIAGDFYSTKGGAEKIDNTHGMSGRLFEGFAAGVMKDRGIKEGDIQTVISRKGAEGMKSTLDEARKAGADTDSDQYKALVDVYRVTREREKQSQQTDEYKEIQKIEEGLKKFEGVDESELTSEQKAERDELNRQLSTKRRDMNRKVDEALKGKTIEGETIDGQKYGAKTITEEDLKLSRQQQEQGGIQGELITENAKREIHEAMRRTAKNVKDLGEIFGTDDFGDLQRIARELGMGSLTDKDNVERVTRAITNAQVLAEETGRSVQSILHEQGNLMNVYSKIYGGAERVDRTAVERNQRISASAGKAAKEAGKGSTTEEIAAETAAADAAAMEETADVAFFMYELFDNKDAVLSEEARAEGMDIYKRWQQAEEDGDQEAMIAVRAEMKQWTDKYARWNENKQKLANTKYGSRLSGTWNMARVMHNVDVDIDNLTEEQVAAYKDLGTDIQSEESRQQIKDVLKNVSNETLNKLRKASDESPEALHKKIEELLAEAKGKMSEEDYKNYERALRGYEAIGEGGRRFINESAYEEGNEGRVTTEGEAMHRAKSARKMLDRALEEGKEVEKGGIPAFIDGLLTSDKAITNRDAMLKYMQDKGYIGENGVIDDEAIKKLNQEDKGAFGLQIDEKTGTIRNTDVLDKMVKGKDGKMHPLWEVMGLGATREEALKNAKDINKVSDGLLKLDEAGISAQGVGGGNIVFFDAYELDKRKEAMEEVRKAQLPTRRMIDAYNTEEEHIKNPKFDAEGNLVEATIDGEKVTGKDNIQKKLDKLREKSPAIQKALEKLKKPTLPSPQEAGKSEPKEEAKKDQPAASPTEKPESKPEATKKEEPADKSEAANKEPDEAETEPKGKAPKQASEDYGKALKDAGTGGTAGKDDLLKDKEKAKDLSEALKEKEKKAGKGDDVSDLGDKTGTGLNRGKDVLKDKDTAKGLADKTGAPPTDPLGTGGGVIKPKPELTLDEKKALAEAEAKKHIIDLRDPNGPAERKDKVDQSHGDGLKDRKEQDETSKSPTGEKFDIAKVEQMVHPIAQVMTQLGTCISGSSLKVVEQENS